MSRSGLLARLSEIPADAPALARLGIDGRRLPLRRAWPRSGGGLTLEYAGDGTVVAGQWFPEPVVSYGLVRTAASDRITVADISGETVVLQAGGADRRLPALTDVLSLPAARLLAHRAERRATVARPGVFVKVLPAGRVQAVAAAHRTAPGHEVDVVVPAVVGADDRAGTLELEAIAGDALHELLGRPGHQRHARTVGAALRRFHRSSGRGIVHHGPREEARVLASRLERLRPHEPELHARVAREARPVMAALAALPELPPVILHRDLHDKQIFLTPGGGVGLIDLDASIPGDPASDIGNLLGHIRLRARQAGLPGSAADGVCEALLEGYGMSSLNQRTRIAVYERATELRLACVYAFRPAWDGLASRLVARS